MNPFSRYRVELSLMAFGYSASLLVWMAAYFLLNDADGWLTGAVNALIWAGAILATLGVVLFAIRFFRDVGSP